MAGGARCDGSGNSVYDACIYIQAIDVYVSNAHRFYYLQNFHVALDWLQVRYADVMQGCEHAFLRDFLTLPEASRALLVRMIMRRGERFRTGKLVYDEIGCPRAAAAPLLELGWLDAHAPLTLDEFFSLLRTPEIRAVFREDTQGKARRWLGARRALMLAQLQDQHDHVQPWRAWWPDAGEDMWQVTVHDLCKRLRLMFFGNLRQHWSEFVLADLGVFKYEQVSLSPQARAFSQTQDIDTWLALQACRDGIDEGVAHDELTTRLAALDCANPWLARRRDRVRFLMGQRAERAGDWEAALNCFGANAEPTSAYRHARVLEKAGRWQQALDAACTANAHEEDAQKLARLIPRLQRRLGGCHPRATRAQARPAVATLTLPMSGERVERAVRQHLHTADAPVFYVENALVNGLFGLLCWDAVFADVPGAFFHPFQSGPADLLDRGFAARRRTHLDAALGALDDGRWRTLIRDRYRQKYGVMSPFVHWTILTPDLLELALHCIAAEHLRIWIDRLLTDIRANRTGWPDLIQFFPDRAAYEMIEVKGPGDRLQDNQIRWLAYGATHGMPMRVVHVTWQHTCAVGADEQAA